MALKEITAQGQVKQGLAGPTGLILDRVTTAVAFNNTVAEQTLYSFAVPANTLGTTRKLRWCPTIDALNSTAGAVTYRFRLKFGATTVWDSGAISWSAGTSQTRVPFQFDISGINVNSASSQLWRGMTFFPITNNLSAWVTSLGNGQGYSTGGQSTGTFLNTSAEDTTTAKTFAFTVQHGTAAAGIETKLYEATLELL